MIRKRRKEKQEPLLKATMTVWSLTTEAWELRGRHVDHCEVYLLLSFLVQNYLAFGSLWQLPNFLTCAAANVLFQELRQPAVRLTPQLMGRFTVVLTVATLLFTAPWISVRREAKLKSRGGFASGAAAGRVHRKDHALRALRECHLCQ